MDVTISTQQNIHNVLGAKMAQILKNVNVTGYKLRPVVHVGSEKGRREVYQFIITNTLPSLSSKMRFEPIPGEYCSNCGINGRFKWPLHYDSSLLNDVTDFNFTHEYIGNGAYCERLMVISARVRRLLVVPVEIAMDAGKPLIRFLLNSRGCRFWLTVSAAAGGGMNEFHQLRHMQRYVR